MLRFRAEGTVSVEPDRLAWLSERFSADRIDDDECMEVIGRYHRATTACCIDPHRGRRRRRGASPA
jgi:hypothetical protein